MRGLKCLMGRTRKLLGAGRSRIIGQLIYASHSRLVIESSKLFGLAYPYGDALFNRNYTSSKYSIPGL